MSALTVDNRNYDDMIHYYEARIEALERRLKLVEQRTADSRDPTLVSTAAEGIARSSRQAQTEGNRSTALSA